MSTWNLGINDVSEEMQAFKDKLASKDSQIAAQQTQLMKQAARFDEINSTLNDVLHKLSNETTRVLQLESELSSRSEDLKNEKIASHNVAQALFTAQQKIKSQELEARDLQAILESLSHTSDGHNARSTKLEREKSTLEARIRELEASLRQPSCPPTTPGPSRALRPRSSSLSNFRVTALEQELNEARVSLSQKDGNIKAASDKLAQVQSELIRTSNENLALEKRTSKELLDLRACLEESQEELRYLKEHQDSRSREEELLSRIEEDEAKIAALEALLGDSHDIKVLKDQLRRAEERIKEEGRRVSEGESRHIELIREREEALDELEECRTEISKLRGTLSQKEDYINSLMDRDGNGHDKDAYHKHSELAASDQVSVADAGKLLAAIERLRQERDNLKRSLDFLEHESRFTIDALEAKLAAPSVPTLNASEISDETISRLKVEVDELRARLEETAGRGAEEIQGKEQEIKRLDLALMAFAVVISHLRSEGCSLEHSLINAFSSRTKVQERLDKSQEELEELEERLKELDVKLDVTTLCLEATTSQRNDLMSQLDAKESSQGDEVDRLKNLLQETRDDLEDANIRIAEVSKSLNDVESERDSLVVQVANLTADLNTAQEDLTNAESRYSSLQFHQLSSMSSNEATRALQEQIQELERRVLRRTEQIGIHQHDIKRLETNLRLNEEHIEELTMELEMATAQKNAMIDDCADARETRDQALARLDQMESNMETEVEEADNIVATLVGVIIETINDSRYAIRRSKDDAQRVKEEFHRLDAAHHNALQLLEGMPQPVDDAKQLTIALAISQLEFKRALSSIQVVQEENDSLTHAIRNQQDELKREHAEATSLKEKIETLQHQASTDALNFAIRTAELETQINGLQCTISSTEAAYRTATNELAAFKEQLGATVDNNIEAELVSLKAQHAEELSEVRKRLSKASDSLQELQTRYASDQEEYQRTISDAMRLKQGLEERLAEVSESLQLSQQEKQEIEQVNREIKDELSRLHRDLEATIVDVEQAKASRDELHISFRRVSEELAHLQQDQKDHLAHAAEQSLVVQQQLNDELSALQSKFDEQSLKLDHAIQTADDLARNLQQETTGRSEDQKNHEEQLRTISEERHRVESSLTTLSQEMSIVQGHLEQSRQELEALQEEKLGLQEDVTALEAEIQRSISLERFLENQVKESERKAVLLATELEQTQAELAHSEESAKGAEVNLSLQSIQHKREMADIQRELATLRSQPNLRDVVAELEERNNEMEDLLRAKCAEIEENDDRALEMLKENKKLTTKVESLTRKVQNLQTKLAAAKASVPKTISDTPNVGPPADPAPASSSVHSVSRSRPTTLSNVPPVPPIPSYVSPPIIRTPSQRAVSGPSSLSRPKTPERRAAPPPVFKARTPEKRLIPPTLPSDTLPSESTIGKKRRAPDDFETCESIPPQGFTVDSLPSTSIESTTPRVRRIPSGTQSAFTPVRHQNPRPTAPIPSPKRVMSATSARSSPVIADVTNSPRTSTQAALSQSTKTSKRSWLGKMRGVSSSQTTVRTGDTRTRFERPGEIS